MSIRKCGRRMGKPTTYSSSEPTKAKWFAPLIPSRTIPSAKSDRSSSKKSKSLKRRRPSPTCGSFRRRTRWDLVSLSFPTTKFRRFLFTAAIPTASSLAGGCFFFCYNVFLSSLLCHIDLSYRRTRDPALMDYLFLLVCSECVALQDPYCAWNAATSRCVTVASVALTAQSSLIQSIFTGYSDQCPDNGTRTFSKFFDISAFTKVCLYFCKRQLSSKRKTERRYLPSPKLLVRIWFSIHICLFS